MSIATSMVPMRKRPTPARVERVRRMVQATLGALEEIDSRRSSTIGIPLIRAEAALGRWMKDLERKADR